jgi:hypothetical protein
MNTYGLSSRTQIVLVDVNLEEVFTQDPLKNTLGDYNEEVQKNLSSEFLKSIIIPEVVNETVDIEEGIEVINEEEVNESDILNSYQGYSVGDNITILGRPAMWSSFFNYRNPLQADIIYPFTTTITQIELNSTAPSMEAGDYGWSLSHLIEAGLISHTPESVGEEVTEVEFEVDADSETLSNLSERVDTILEEGGYVDGEEILHN